MKAFKRIFCLTLILVSSLQAEIVTRAALDVGSGESKLVIADIDTDTNKIIRTHYDSYKIVELRKDFTLSKDGNLSLQIQNHLLQTIKGMQEETIQFAPQKWVGIGTSIFRKAKNGEELLNRIERELGIKIHLVSQEQEGILGFQSAVGASGLNPDEVISWDSGSGSFQLTAVDTNEYLMYGAEFGLVHSMEIYFKRRGMTFDPNYYHTFDSIADFYDYVMDIGATLPEPTEWLKNRGDKKIVGIGVNTCIFSLAKIATGEGTFTRKQLRQSLINMSQLSQEELQGYPVSTPLFGLSLLLAVMNVCDIENVTYAPTSGLCQGLLISPEYWVN